MGGALTSKRYTPDDLLRIPDSECYELVDGQLVEHKMSLWSSYVAGRLFFLLQSYCDAHKLGWVLPEGVSYRCFPDPDCVRKADVSFIQGHRMTLEAAKLEGHISVCPDLAVEVLSPHDLAYEIEAKVEDYREAGVRLIWVINPQTRTIRIHRAEGEGTVLHADAELDGEQVVPGFRCRIADLFLKPTGVGAEIENER